MFAYTVLSTVIGRYMFCQTKKSITRKLLNVIVTLSAKTQHSTVIQKIIRAVLNVKTAANAKKRAVASIISFIHTTKKKKADTFFF